MLYFLFMHTQSLEIWFLIEQRSFGSVSPTTTSSMEIAEGVAREKEQKLIKKTFSIKWLNSRFGFSLQIPKSKSFDNKL